MGATTSTAATGTRLPVGVNNLVDELGNDVQYERGMGSSRFLKAIKARHKHGPLVVKTFVKPEAFFSLRPLVRRIRVEREALADVPNTLTYQKVVETDTAGYLIRQWMANNLYDRISTRPFLTIIEKKWITFQLLSAMKEARKRNVPHGDLKTENVLVTSSLSVYVTDFASSFKQVYLPLNDPSDFNFYFGTSGRRTCYVAPERFYSEDSDIAKQKAKARAEANVSTSSSQAAEAMGELLKRDGKVTEAMDVFSLGCVIAELWRDGAPMFTLMQLYKYRDAQFDIEAALSEIPDKHVRRMVRSMLSLDPKKRNTFAEYFESAEGACFPSTFYSFLHRYLTTLQRTSARTAAMAAAEATAAAAATAVAASTTANDQKPPTTSVPSEIGLAAGGMSELAYLLRAEADERIERMYEEWSVVARVLDEKQVEWDNSSAPATPSAGGATGSLSNILPVTLAIPGLAPDALLPSSKPVIEDGPALLILSPLLANLRNAVRPSTKLHCFDLLLHLSTRWLSDEAKLDRVLPYLVALFDDESILVRMAVVRTVVQLLALVDMITPSNASTFIEYVMPNLRVVARDSSSLVRSTYAACLVELTRIGTRYVQMASAMRAEGVFAADVDVGTETADEFMEGGEARLEAEVNFDRQMDVLRSFFQEQALLLLTDTSPIVKRTLLANIGPLCTFFGADMTNDVARVAGAQSVEDFIITLLLQALSDPEEFVVLHVLQGLHRLLSLRLLSRFKTYDVLAATAGFLCHPNHWLRSAAAFIVARGATQIGTTDVWAFLYPSVRPLLRSDVRSIKPTNLLFAVKEPISREVLQKAVQWAFRAKNSKFWKASTVGDTNARASFYREGVGLMIGRQGKSVARTPIPRNEEDDAHIDSLRSSGLSEEDEVKLVALRDYITKLAKQSNLIGPSAVKSTNPTPTVNQEDATLLPPLQIKSSLAVQPLEDITPLTIFFTTGVSSSDSSKTVDNAAAAETASVPASMRSHAASSTFSGRIARKRLGGGGRVVSETFVIEELRTRMRETTDVLALPSTPIESTDTKSGALAPAQQGLRQSGKAHAAIASDTTSAMGTMAEGSARMRMKDRMTSLQFTSSGQSTPTTPMTPTLIDAAGGGGGGGVAATKHDVGGGGESTFSSTYEGNDPYIRAHLEAVYLANFQERQASWGPTIAARSSRVKSRSAAGVASNRRPEGNLVAYFTEHSAPITSIVTSPDHAFFLSGSEDGTIKVWDTARLEKNVTSRSRGTYNGQRGKITALIMLEGSHCAASAATDGSVHVVRVEMAAGGSSSLPKYGKVRLVSNFQLSDPTEYVVAIVQSVRKSGVTTREATATVLILATSKSHIIVLDLRTMQVLTSFDNPAHLGCISSMCVDPKNIWLLVATIDGAMCLWDLRFHLLVKTWSLTTEAKVNSLLLHPTKGKGRWVMVALERLNLSFQGEQAATSQVLIETWDLESMTCVESYEWGSSSRNSRNTPLPGPATAAEAIERLVRAHERLETAAAAEEETEVHDDAKEQNDGRRVKGREVIPPPAPTAYVRSMLVGTEGYTSSSVPHSALVSGGWLDAGKLVNAAAADSTKNVSTGPAGYMITAGMDRRIRFWDLGRVEKSTAFGASTDERNEFSTTKDTTHYVHQTHATSATLRAATSALRSPLLTHHASLSTTNMLMKAHKDAITALSVIESPFRCIVAGDYAGNIRVWE